MAIDGTSGNDNLTGSIFAETINGYDGDDTIDGGNASDILNGGAGNDTFLFASRFSLNPGEIINGGSGNDTLQLNDAGDYDFRAAIVSSIERVKFGNSEVTSADFYTSQLGSGLSSTATIVGSGNRAYLDFFIDTPSVDLSNLNFQQWTDSIVRIQISTTVHESGVSITGSQVDDRIFGTDENDTIRGHTGDDHIHGSGGADRYFGGGGDDVFYYSRGGELISDEIIDGGAGTDTIRLGYRGEYDFRTTTLRSIEELDFGSFYDSKIIINSSQFGSGLSASATLSGDPGRGESEFHVYVDAASTDLSGLTFQDWEDENDEVVVFGSNGSDTVRGTSIGDTMYGYSGGDVLHGFGGTDTLIGGTGDDQLFGGRGNDIIESASGTNTLVGGRGNDTVTGGNDVDTIYGNIGADRLFGNEGDDALYGGGWSDRVYGGDGDDTIHGNRGNDRLFGDSGNDTMTGGHGHDFIDGGSGNDQIHGNGFADELHGGSGDDSIYGGAGSDIINGGGDSDSLWGGDGRSDDGVTDRFVFESSFGEDRIRDFENGLDKIDFAGNATFNDFATVSANATQSGSDILITQNAGNTLTIEDMNLADLDASDFLF